MTTTYICPPEPMSSIIDLNIFPRGIYVPGDVCNTSTSIIAGSGPNADFTYVAGIVPDSAVIDFAFGSVPLNIGVSTEIVGTPDDIGISKVVYDTSDPRIIQVKWSLSSTSISIIYTIQDFIVYEYNITFVASNSLLTQMDVILQVVTHEATSDPMSSMITPNSNNRNYIVNSDSPTIIITADLSQITSDVLEVQYNVIFEEFYTCGFGCYNGYVQHNTLSKSSLKILSKSLSKAYNKQTLFYLVPLNIGMSVVGSDDEDLIYKIAQTPFGSNIGPLIVYALLKMILARVLFGKFNSKWLYRKNYNKLIRAVLDSPYRVFYEVYLGPNKSFEIYFKENLIC